MKVFDTVSEFETYTQPGINSGEVYFVRESERAYFRTNNIDGVDRTYSLNTKEIIIDDELSETSENPVQNKVITLALNDKADTATTYTKTEVDGLIEDYFDGAEYDSQTTRINFKHGDTVKAYIDASDFVIDGMIDNVEIVTVEGVKYLKITFNTESGKEPILIPLADIFNPDNYYTKTEVDTALNAKANSSDVYTKTVTDTLLADKADKSTTYTKTEVDTALASKVDVSALDDIQEVIATSLNELENDKANASDVYTKTEIDAMIGDVETLLSQI